MKKLRKLWLVKYFKNYFLVMVCLTILEILFRLNEKLSIFSYAGLRIFLGINILALFFSFILDYLPKIVAKIWNCLIVLVFSIYGIVELGFNHYLGAYASLQINTQASAVSNYVFDFIKSFKWQFYLLLIPFLLLVGYYIFIDKKVDLDLPKKKITMNVVTINIFKFLLVIFVCFLYFLTLKLDFMQNKLQATKTIDLFKKPSIPSLVVNDFGFIGFGILDVKDYFFPGKEIELNIEYDPDTINLNHSTSTNLDEPTKIYTNQVSIDNENWKNIIAKEKNKTLNNINKYLISNRITTTNDYTGLFEGKNLIVIMVESGSNIMLNEKYYPNIAKIYNEGWTWKNYYSPRNSCSTGNNEMSGMTGLYTIYNNCTVNLYKNNSYFESLFNLFNNKDYTTNSFHDHIDAYYYRTTIHKNMGSKKFYKVQDMNIPYSKTYGKWASDAEMMKYYLSVIDSRDTKKPFMSWITTVTSHMPYKETGAYSTEYQDLFPSNLPNDLKYYMSKLKVVDNAIGVLLDGLEERDLLEDTVIALYCDHYPYGVPIDNLETVLNYDLSEDNNTDQVPFIIYNKGMEKKEFSEYTSYINLTPTLANLFGLEYDSRLYMGEDIFNKDYKSMVVFADGSWKNEVAYYNASTNRIKYYTEKVYSEEEILAINKEISLKLKMSSAVIKNNYFNYLNNELKKYTTSE